MVGERCEFSSVYVFTALLILPRLLSSGRFKKNNFWVFFTLLYLVNFFQQRNRLLKVMLFADQFSLWLRFLLNDRLNVISSAPLTVSADYVGYSCDDQVAYQWILYEEYKEVEWIAILNNSENSKVFTIDPNFLKDNKKYRLESTVLLNNETPSTSVQVFQTAVLPRDGSCTVTPDTGEAVYTSFELLCSGWLALNETFTYEVQIIGDGDIHYTLYYGHADNQVLILPQGNASRGYLSHVKVYVSRLNGATSELEIPITVWILFFFSGYVMPLFNIDDFMIDI